jgi:hypothetical protein
MRWTQDQSLVPPQFARILERVRAAADIMPRKQLEKVLTRELGADWPTKFKVLGPTPISTAQSSAPLLHTLPHYHSLSSTPISILTSISLFRTSTFPKHSFCISRYQPFTIRLIHPPTHPHTHSIPFSTPYASRSSCNRWPPPPSGRCTAPCSLTAPTLSSKCSIRALPNPSTRVRHWQIFSIIMCFHQTPQQYLRFGLQQHFSMLEKCEFICLNPLSFTPIID